MWRIVKNLLTTFFWNRWRIGRNFRFKTCVEIYSLKKKSSFQKYFTSLYVKHHKTLRHVGGSYIFSNKCQVMLCRYALWLFQNSYSQITILKTELALVILLKESWSCVRLLVCGLYLTLNLVFIAIWLEVLKSKLIWPVDIGGSFFEHCFPLSPAAHPKNNGSLSIDYLESYEWDHEVM